MQNPGALLSMATEGRMATFFRKGIEDYVASVRRKPFHTAVAAPEVRTGRIRVS
jgi:hypothetical protein